MMMGMMFWGTLLAVVFLAAVVLAGVALVSGPETARRLRGGSYSGSRNPSPEPRDQAPARGESGAAGAVLQRLCPACNSPVEADWRLCPRCGQVLV